MRREAARAQPKPSLRFAVTTPLLRGRQVGHFQVSKHLSEVFSAPAASADAAATALRRVQQVDVDLFSFTLKLKGIV